MDHYTITGMSCAACSARVEKAVRNVEGVTACSVSLLTNSMTVEGTAPAKEIIRAVEASGYGAAEKNARMTVKENDDALSDKETPKLKKRLIASLFLLVPLMYLSMGHMMWHWPVPAFLHTSAAMGLAQMILAAAVMVINQKFYISGFSALAHRAPNMDTLVALGSSVSFAWSLYVLFASVNGAAQALTFYFESAAMIVTLITVGKLLEARSKGKTTDALKSLMRLAPQTATILQNGRETVVPIARVAVGDVFLVRPGEAIPVDGTVEQGESAVNESSLTGESVPTDKTPGDTVYAATLNQSGFLTCRASRVGEDTSFAQIVRLVSDASASKAPVAKIADRVSGVFVPVVMAIAFVAFLGWLLAGAPVADALSRGIAVLVISCPCALGLATPVAIMVGNGVAARAGILFKTAESLEETGRVEIVALDKTGTITGGEPSVTDVIPQNGVTEEELLCQAASLEAKSEHPLAKAILDRAAKDDLPLLATTEFLAMPGNGLTARAQEATLAGGNQVFIRKHAAITQQWEDRARSFADEGKTPLFFARNGELLGMICVADTLKSESAQAISELKNLGARVVMLTGDNERTANAIAARAGVDEVIAGVLPDEKEKVIRDLQKQGKVMMVGDGLNDAPALSRADVGVAIGAGADTALDAADVVLVKSRLTDVSAAIRLSRATKRIIYQNLFWAFFYNLIGIPLAAGVLGLALDPMFGAAAMSLSSFCVVSNALRLNRVRLYDARRDRKRKRKGERSMEKVLLVEGMMCPHCEARVQKTLEALDGVKGAQADHKTGTVTVELSKSVADETLAQAVQAQGYAVKGFK